MKQEKNELEGKNESQKIKIEELKKELENGMNKQRNEMEKRLQNLKEMQ